MKEEYAKQLLEKVKQDYNLAAQEFSNRRQSIWQEMRFLFDDFLQPHDKALDLGCGNGRFFEVMQGKEVDYYGVDISEELIEIAKQQYPQTNFQVGSALNIPFNNNFFDKVYLIAVLHNIPSKSFRLQALEEAKRVLKPGGLVIATCWNLWPCPKKRNLILKYGFLKIVGKTKLDFKDIFIPFAGMESCYFHCFTKRELEKLAKKAQLAIRESGKIIVGQEKRPNSNFYIVAEK